MEFNINIWSTNSTLWLNFLEFMTMSGPLGVGFMALMVEIPHIVYSLLSQLYLTKP